MLSQTVRLFPEKPTELIDGMRKTVPSSSVWHRDIPHGSIMEITVVGTWSTPFWRWRTHVGNGTTIDFPHKRFRSLDHMEQTINCVMM